MLEGLVELEGNVVEFGVCFELVADGYFFDASVFGRDVQRSACTDGGGKGGVREGVIHHIGDQ